MNDTDTCACDMRHPDDDSPFGHHPCCISRPRYTSNLPMVPENLGLKTIKITGDVIVTTKGVQLVCAACDAPFTIDQWLMRHWHLDGNLYHEECCTDE